VGVKVPSILGPQVTKTVGDTRVAFARPARSLPSSTMLAQTIVTNLTFVRVAKEDHLGCVTVSYVISTYCLVSGFGSEMKRTVTGLFIKVTS